MKAAFKIQNKQFDQVIFDSLADKLPVKSSPRDYYVESFSRASGFTWIEELISREKRPIVLVDKHIKDTVLRDVRWGSAPVYALQATEKNKNIDNVLKACDFLLANNANRGSSLFVIGGGILQDIGAMSGYLYKRGIPWHFIPTTLLSQCDSCVGGKTAVNYKRTKNVLALFSAPRSVDIDVRFLKTLPRDAILSGIGEMLRLCITGGAASLGFFEQNIDQVVNGDYADMEKLIACSLSIKKAIVEHDEFELDIRRSMNYGHSIGHAIEAASKYRIPHGIGVTIGMLIENQIASDYGMLSDEERERIVAVSSRLVPDHYWNLLKEIDPEDLLPLLKNDKKAEGAVLKLATLQSIGDMRFIDLPLDDTGIGRVSAAVSKVLSRVGE